MTEQTNQCADEQSKSSEKQICNPAESANGPKEEKSKRAYVKPTLRKFSQIDYVTAYGVD